MKKKILSSLVLAGLATSAFAANSTKPIMHLQQLQAKDKKLNSNANFIRPGLGYSEDAQSLGLQECFAVKDIKESAGQSKFVLDTALSFTDIERELKTGVSASVGIGLFGGGFSIDYLKAMRDTDLSYSLNYINYATNNIAVNLDLADGGLTPTGKTLYDNVHNLFGVSCGNEVITSYQTGAMLLFGLNLKFHNHSDLETFKSSIHAGFGGIFSAAAYIEKVAKEKKINGTVAINAYQVGGKPERLSDILSKDSKGGYYVLNCSMQNMTSCLKAAEGILDYASSQGTHATDGFSKQFDLSKNENLEPFGVGFADKMDIMLIGLNPATTLVTPEVKQARKDLVNDLKENQYYKEHLGAILNGYPVALDSQYRTQLTDLYKKAEENIKTLMGTDGNGGIKCYTQPYNCVATAQELESNLKPISEKEIETDLKPIKNYYNFTRNDSHTLMYDFYPDGNTLQYINHVVLNTILRWNTLPSFSDTSLSFNVLTRDDGLKTHKEQSLTYSASSTTGSMTATARFSNGYSMSATANVLTSPYYFTPYKANASEAE